MSNNGTYWSKAPNWLFEKLPEMTEGVLKVTLHVCRQTLGWKREWDRISYNQFVEGTGLSRQSVHDSLEAALEAGYIQRRPNANSFDYALGAQETVNSADQSTQQTSQDSRPETVNTVDQNDAEMVNSVDSQKKLTTKERKDTTIVAANAEQGVFQNLPKPSKKREKPKPNKPFQVYQQLTEVQRGINKGQTLSDAKELLEAGFTVQEIVACGRWIKNKPYLKERAIPLNPSMIVKQIDNWKELGCPKTHCNGNGSSQKKRKKRRRLTPADRPPALEVLE